MNARLGRRSLWVVIVLAVALVISLVAWNPDVRATLESVLGLPPSGEQVDQCHMMAPSTSRVERIDVYNFYGDHLNADHHTVPVADIDGYVCDDILTFTARSRRDFSPDELSGLAVTVFVLTFNDAGARNPTYVYRLRDGGYAVKEATASWYVPAGNFPQYYAADAEQIQRAFVPPL